MLAKDPSKVLNTSTYVHQKVKKSFLVSAVMDKKIYATLNVRWQYSPWGGQDGTVCLRYLSSISGLVESLSAQKYSLRCGENAQRRTRVPVLVGAIRRVFVSVKS